jgi:predicted nucleic acid-binding Zn ribbon protein
VVAEKQHQVCLICGKPSPKTICDACADRLRGEALEKKKKEEKINE